MPSLAQDISPEALRAIKVYLREYPKEISDDLILRFQLFSKRKETLGLYLLAAAHLAADRPFLKMKLDIFERELCSNNAHREFMAGGGFIRIEVEDGTENLIANRLLSECACQRIDRELADRVASATGRDRPERENFYEEVNRILEKGENSEEFNALIKSLKAQGRLISGSQPFVPGKAFAVHWGRFRSFKANLSDISREDTSDFMRIIRQRIIDGQCRGETRSLLASILGDDSDSLFRLLEKGAIQKNILTIYDGEDVVYDETVTVDKCICARR